MQFLKKCLKLELRDVKFPEILNHGKHGKKNKKKQTSDSFIRLFLNLSEINFHGTYYLGHVKWDPCHHNMANGGESLQIWRVAANILNKQSQAANRE
jgi:hypothetical protein